MLDQFPIAIPECCPLHTGGHFVITVDGNNTLNGVLEDRSGFLRFVGVQIHAARKDQRIAEDCRRIGRHCAGELEFNCRRDERGWRNRRRICDGGRVRDSWGERDRRAERNCRREGDGWCQAGGWGWIVKGVDRWFAETTR